MEFPFIKMHGIGNNYIYLDLFKINLKESLIPNLARSVADVNRGIGSDGLILIHPSNIADVGMRIFNKDGSEGQSCGNGLRCTAKYAYESGLVNNTNFCIETKAGVVDAIVSVRNNTVTNIIINMGIPRLNRHCIPMIGNDDKDVIAETFSINGWQMKVTALSMGNPHAVFIVDNIEEAPLHELGPLMEKDPRFPDGVNVEFIEVISERKLHLRVWERGSGVTEACGTGACAAVVATILNGRMRRDEDITVYLSGGELKIKWDANGFVWMSGGAEMVATGIYYYSTY